MDIPLALTTGLTLSGQAIDLIKQLRAADLSLDKAESKQKLADLHMLIADLKISLSDTKMAINERDSKILELETALKKHASLIYKEPFYFTEAGDGPFCARCYDKEKLLMRLYETRAQGWECKNCRSKYLDDSASVASVRIQR